VVPLGLKFKPQPRFSSTSASKLSRFIVRANLKDAFNILFEK